MWAVVNSAAETQLAHSPHGIFLGHEAVTRLVSPFLLFSARQDVVAFYVRRGVSSQTGPYAHLGRCTRQGFHFSGLELQAWLGIAATVVPTWSWEENMPICSIKVGHHGEHGKNILVVLCWSVFAFPFDSSLSSLYSVFLSDHIRYHIVVTPYPLPSIRYSCPALTHLTFSIRPAIPIRRNPSLRYYEALIAVVYNSPLVLSAQEADGTKNHGKRQELVFGLVPPTASASELTSSGYTRPTNWSLDISCGTCSSHLRISSSAFHQ